MATSGVLPPNLSAGNSLSAMWFQKLLTAVRRYRPIAGRNITVSETPNGCVINGTPGGSAFGGGSQTTLKPFALRWMDHGKGEGDKSDGGNGVAEGEAAGGEWQIYLPMGCVSVNGDAATPANETGHDGNDELTYQWHTIQEPVDSDASIEAAGGYVYKSWDVRVMVKPYPLFKATTKSADEAFGAVNSSVSVGSIFVKSWTDKEGKSHSDRSSVQSRFEPYDLEFDNEGSFRIIYSVTGDRKDPASWKAKLTNQFITVGRDQVWIEDDTDITDMSLVVLKIDHSKMKMAISIQDRMDDNTMDATFVKILKMDAMSIVDDLREEARKTFPFYNN